MLVFWAVGGEEYGCKAIVNSPRYEADEYMFGGILRPDSLWLGGRPTIDLVPSWYTLFRASKLEPGFTLDTILQFITVLPTAREWSVDCRPVTERAERWFEAHRSVAGGRISQMVAQLRPTCRQWLTFKAIDERTAVVRGSPVLPDRARQALVANGCREDTVRHGQFPRWFVTGRFEDSTELQYATICQDGESWRILLVESSPAVEVKELSRMAGTGTAWSLLTVRSEFFTRMTSRAFSPLPDGQASVPKPSHDVLLLMSGPQMYATPQLAFFAMPQGWVQVGVECCNWPIGGAPPPR